MQVASFSDLFGPLNQQIKQFETRIEVDGLEFCTSLYEDAEIKLMACKYAYYVKDNPYKKDEAYDILEHCWYVMGRALGDLEEDETSPCVGWDSGHRSAKKGMELAERLMQE